MNGADNVTQPVVCQLQTPGLAGLPSPVFRRAADDGVPVLVLRMGDRDAVVPLRGLQRRFGIADASPDGIMLGRIAEALDFVQELRPGDPLPAEVLTGEASWEPDAVHMHIAVNRLRGHLAQWLYARGGTDDGATRRHQSDEPSTVPVSDKQLNAVFRKVAAELRLPDAHSATRLVEAVARELACIEALRERLLYPLRKLARKLDAISQNQRGDAANMEMLTLVRRLCRTALERIGSRFSAVDDSLDDVMAVLSGWEAQRLLLRSNRDWLYRSYRAFDAFIQEWDAAPMQIDEHFWNRLGRTYRFLAPRFMAVQEWKQAQRPRSRQVAGAARMQW